MKHRRVVQAVVFEVVAVLLVGPAMGWVFDRPIHSTLALAVVMSFIALLWNMAFNTVFERWEARQTVKGRSWRRRIVHGSLFEIGLSLLLIPLMAWWLETTLLAALVADFGFIAFFFFYTIAFTWVFDRVFGLPASALKS